MTFIKVTGRKFIPSKGKRARVQITSPGFKASYREAINQQSAKFLVKFDNKKTYRCEIGFQYLWDNSELFEKYYCIEDVLGELFDAFWAGRFQILEVATYLDLIWFDSDNLEGNVNEAHVLTMYLDEPD